MQLALQFCPGISWSCINCLEHSLGAPQAMYTLEHEVELAVAFTYSTACCMRTLPGRNCSSNVCSLSGTSLQNL